MKGQWLGSYDGSLKGSIMVNIDQVDTHFEGVAYLRPDDNAFPSSVAYFTTESLSNSQSMKALLTTINPETGAQDTWETVHHMFGDNIEHSNESEVHLELQDGKLSIQSESDIGAIVTCCLQKPADDEKSKIDGKKMSWSEYKNFIAEYSDSRYLYRGQSQPWRLRTAFHRGDRYRISTFINRDVKLLHQRLSAVTDHYFDLTIPDQNGAFFNLLQHHGYPTPLLDWTYSPYVAAFFAFRGVPHDTQDSEDIRIYVFNNPAWQSNYPQIVILDPIYPHLSVAEFIAINNPRLVPQQAATTATNVDDIEAYLLSMQASEGAKYLTAIDIPAQERATAMKELRIMGITAGSMFPGIEGICEELRELNFNN